MTSELPQLETDFISGIEPILLEGEVLMAYPRGRHSEFKAKPARITVFLPVFNAETRLLRCLQSIADQTHGDYQVILIDNVSTDASYAMACKFAEKNPKFLVYQNARNLGRVENWNRGLSLSGGEYLKPVMVNDYLLPTCLDELCKVLDENPNAAMARCSMTTLNNGVLNFEPLFPESRMHWGLEAIEYGLTTANIAAGPSAQMFRSAPILDHKLRYDTRYEWAADFEFTMRLFAAGGIFYLRQSLFVYEYTKRYATQSKFRVELRDELNVIGSMADLYKEHLDRETLQRAQARAQSLYKYYRGRCSTDEEQAQCDLLWEQAQSTFPMLRQTLDVSSTFTRDIGQKFNFDPATCR